MVVAREHGHTHTQSLKCRHAVAGGGLWRVAGIHHREKAAVCHQIHARSACMAFILNGPLGHRRNQRLQQPLVAKGHLHLPAGERIGTLSRNALPRKGLKRGHCHWGHIPLGSPKQHGFGQGVLAVLLQAGSQGHGLVLRDLRVADYRDQLRHSLGESAGLVKDHVSDGACPFQRLAVLDEQAFLGAAAGAYHDGSGHCQTQGAGARHHDHRDPHHEGALDRSAVERALGGQHADPHHKGDRCDG